MDGLSVCLSVCLCSVCVCFFFRGTLCLCFRVLGLLRNFFFSKREGAAPLHPHPSGVGPRATPLFGGLPPSSLSSWWVVLDFFFAGAPPPPPPHPPRHAPFWGDAPRPVWFFEEEKCIFTTFFTTFLWVSNALLRELERKRKERKRVEKGEEKSAFFSRENEKVVGFVIFRDGQTGFCHFSRWTE